MCSNQAVESWSASGPELPLVLDGRGHGPLTVQLQNALRTAVREGRLAVHARLPSTRTLALDLGISRGTVAEAYRQLVAEGYLIARSGSGTRVAGAATAPVAVSPLPTTDVARLRWDFRPSVPDLALFPRAAWARSLHEVLRSLPDRDLGYGDPPGSLRLRTELAGYLHRVRNVLADPERIVICAGFTQALSLICRTLRDRGPFAVEDPGSPSAWARIQHAGIEAVPIPVDEQGLAVTALAGSRAGAVVVTPAHQFPTGSTLSPARRAALLSWAADGGLIIEDDYDAEFRYDRHPVGALQGLAPEHVLYVGSLSKTLAPALRLGWMVLPSALVEAVTEAKNLEEMGSPGIDQHAFAHLLASGGYDHHLRRARRRYRAKRDTLVAALRTYAPSVRVNGIAAGLHAVTSLPPYVDEQAITTAAKKHGVGVYPLTDYHLGANPIEHALLLGYGGLRESSIAHGVRRLGAILDSAGQPAAQRRPMEDNTVLDAVP